jgi:hypothetical protein
MLKHRTILFLAAFSLIAIYWLSTFYILRDAPLLDGPQDEADAALAFFLRRTGISFLLMVALFVALIVPWPRGKPSKVEPWLE